MDIIHLCLLHLCYTFGFQKKILINYLKYMQSIDNIQKYKKMEYIRVMYSTMSIQPEHQGF